MIRAVRARNRKSFCRAREKKSVSFVAARHRTTSEYLFSSLFAIIFVCTYNNRKNNRIKTVIFARFRCSDHPLRMGSAANSSRAKQNQPRPTKGKGREEEEGGRDFESLAVTTWRSVGRQKSRILAKEPLCFPNEVLCAHLTPSPTPSRPARSVRKILARRIGASWLLLLFCSPLSLFLILVATPPSLSRSRPITATRAARFQHVSTMMTRRGKDLCMCVRRSDPPPIGLSSAAVTAAITPEYSGLYIRDVIA